MKTLRYDLGGIGRGGNRTTVNIQVEADIQADITQLDSFCMDGTVDEFYLSHTLEHVPSGAYRDFLCGMLRKLKPGGVVRVVQTDAGGVLQLWKEGKLSLRAARTTLFPPADRLRRNPYNQHYNMWDAEMLAGDFLSCGFAPVEVVDAGTWGFDCSDELHPGECERFHGTRIPNLGIVAMRPAAVSGVPLATVTDAEAGIPRIIHQTWKTRDIGPPFRAEWTESWREMNPGWEYRLWTDEDLLAFVAAEFPDFLPVYLSYDAPIKRVDAARYLIMKRLGGVYADLDFVCLRPLEPLLAGEFLVFGNQSPCSWEENGADPVCNAFMASAPGHPFWDGIELALAASARRRVLEATGTVFLTNRSRSARFFFEPGHFPTVLPMEVLYPIVWNDPAKESLSVLKREELAVKFPNSFAITLWTGSWLQSENSGGKIRECPPAK